MCAPAPGRLPNNDEKIAMKTKDTNAPPVAVGRVVGLDLHPEVFSAAVLAGQDAATAQVVQNWDRLGTDTLETWGRKLRPGDVVVLEATGNAFEAAQRLRECGASVVVLETQRAGQIRNSYCKNDRSDAVKLARIYLSGLARVVWQPDPQTRERREVLQRYLRAGCDATRARNRLKSFLSSHRLRVPRRTRLTQPSGRARVLGLARWTSRQQLLLNQMLDELAGADQRRRELAALIATEVVSDPTLLRLLRLLGVRHVIAFAIGACIGDVARFPNPKKLVAYIGLSPRVQVSGNGGRGPESLPKYGRKDLRSLLVQAAHVALRQTTHPLHAWAWKLHLRKSHKNIAVAAVARKIAVSAWYCLKGLLPALHQPDESLELKLGKIASVLGIKTIKLQGFASKADFIRQKTNLLTAPA